MKHYIKNLLIFVPLIFSGKLFEINKFVPALMGTVCFCLLSSTIYIINDVKDADKDAIHPIKKNRPIASGEISKKTAFIILCFLIISSFLVSVLFIRGYFSLIFLAVYFILNVMYSFGLKNVALVDLCILVSGFLIRILYGGAIANIVVSDWLYLTVISASFYFALGKRRNEMDKYGCGTRTVLSQYSKEFLDKNMYMCMGLTNGFYALWAIEQDNSFLVITVPIVLILSMRYSLIIEGDSEGDPIEVLINDKVMRLSGMVYILIMFIVLYLS